MREKLIDLIIDAKRTDPETGSFTEHLADHLIANGVTVQKWIPVTERLPEDARTVLAVDLDGTIATAYYVGRWHSGGDLDENTVIGWMPLPSPPTCKTCSCYAYESRRATKRN